MGISDGHGHPQRTHRGEAIMTFDYFEHIIAVSCDKIEDAPARMYLSSGFPDYCAKGGSDERTRNAARQFYVDTATKLQPDIPGDLGLVGPSPALLSTWFAVAIDFTLQTPWYSKDDRPFHVLD